MPADWLDMLADFLAGFRFDSLAPATVEQTSYVILDTIGAIGGGAAEPEMRALTARLTDGPAGDASVIGTGLTASSATAALLNGTAGTFLEMDEGNRFARGHPAIHVLPVLWAVAESRGLSGKAVMEALVLGYEVGARVGIAAALRPDMHPHGTWGTVGAAAALAKLRGHDAARLRETINVASSLTLATSKRTMLEGGTVRNTYAGIANRLALMAIDLVETGFTGERDGLSSVFGRVVSDRFDSARMVDGLGRDWQIDRNYFKLHSCCRYNHGALDALDNLLARETVAADAVERVDVASYLYAAELDDQAPRNTLGAKFSVPFAVATRLVRGSSRVENFTWDAVRDAKVQAMAKRVFVTEDKAMTAKLPQLRPARVTLQLGDGRTLAASVDTNRGDDQAPYSRDELTGKYFSLAERVWSHEAADALRRRLLALADATSIKGLIPRPS
ncbi:MAG: MmgE/PrpD family protein [Reyranella sp.]|nr:MmgE/PrpD family protein [Reyranella sp.]